MFAKLQDKQVGRNTGNLFCFFFRNIFYWTARLTQTRFDLAFPVTCKDFGEQQISNPSKCIRQTSSNQISGGALISNGYLRNKLKNDLRYVIKVSKQMFLFAR